MLIDRILAFALFLIIGVVGAWVFLGTYARIENVPGLLVTNKPSAKVQVLAAGVVSNLSVKEGQKVSKGEKIAALKFDRETENGSFVAGSSVAAIDEQSDLAKEQISITRKQSAAEIRRLKAAINAASSQASSLAGQITLQKEVVVSNQSIYDQMGKVIERGFVSKFEYEARNQALIGSKQTLANLEQQHMVRLSEIEQAKAQIASLPIDALAQVTNIKSNIQQLSQQKAQLQGQQAVNIIAPISGLVTNLQTASGRVVQPGRPIMSIVPDGAKLNVELYAPSRAIGFVDKGDEVRILYDAFPYQRFGSHPGIVESVSRIVIDPREASIPIQLEEAVYKITVKLDAQVIKAYGDTIPLQAGMTLQANVVLERQSFFDWLLTPLNAILKRTS